MHDSPLVRAIERSYRGTSHAEGRRRNPVDSGAPYGSARGYSQYLPLQYPPAWMQHIAGVLHFLGTGGG